MLGRGAGERERERERERAAKRDQPDVILFDNRMGGMTGIETLQMLRGAQPQAMVILMTAFGTTQTAIEAMKFGAYDYVMKLIIMSYFELFTDVCYITRSNCKATDVIG